MEKRVRENLGAAPTAWKLLPLAVAVAIAGCGGGSSGGGGNGGDGGNGGGNGSDGSSLSGSQQAIAVAYTVAGRAESLADQALDQSSDAAGGAEAGVSAQSSLVSAATTTEPFDDCVAVDDSVEAGFRIQEGDALDLANVEFPEQFTSSPGNDIGQKADARGRANCDTGQLTALGGYDIAQREDIDGVAGKRLVFAESGGLGADSLSFDDAPDFASNFQLETSVSGVSIPKLRYQLYACNGCVDGDLSDWTGDPTKDITSVAFLELETDISGNQSYSRLGTPAAPFALQTAPDPGGTGDIQVEVDGEYEVSSGGLAGCSLNATISTRQNGPLYVDSFTGDDVTPTGGAIDITPAGSGETFTVEFPSGGGTPLINGEQVNEEDLTAVSACGYVEDTSTPEEPEEAPDITGTWAMTECEPSGVDEWTSLYYTFNQDGTGVVSGEVFIDEACEFPFELPTERFSYEVGEPVDNSPQSVQAYELDLVYDSSVEVYDLYGIDGNTLLLTDPEDNPDEEEFRDTQLFTDFGYQRQQ